MRRRKMLAVVPALVATAITPSSAAAAPVVVPSPSRDAWRRVLVTTVGVEPGLTRLSLYVSHDQHDWRLLEKGLALAPNGDGDGFYPSVSEFVLSPDQRFIGLIANRWTTTTLQLSGPDGPLNVGEATRRLDQVSGIMLPVVPSDELSTDGPISADFQELVYWDVSGEHGLASPAESSKAPSLADGEILGSRESVDWNDPRYRSSIRVCLLGGPGRGDCLHYVGLPAEAEGNPLMLDPYPTDVLDDYGVPRGWCILCWHSWRLSEIEKDSRPGGPTSGEWAAARQRWDQTHFSREA